MVKSEMEAEGKPVSIKKLCHWFGVARSSFYYRIRKSKRKPKPLNKNLVKELQKIIQENPTYGLRQLTAVLRKRLKKSINRKAVHRIIKANGWQVRKKRTGFKKRAQGMRSRSERSNERWAIDATSIFCGEDGWCPLTAIIDCHDRSIVGWRLSLSGVSKYAAAALEEALIARKAELPSEGLLLRSDNGLIFGSKPFVRVAKEYGIDQEYITPYTPEQNGMIERFFRTLKEECIWQSSFKSRDEAFIAIAAWMDKYHRERPHSGLGYLTPEEYRNGVQAV
ncbi:MAG: IS3 family transposase [Flavobacteriaceae bacterium]|nr:IS3 family transposase [Flavobacteriaceae bacterium]MCB1073655.1 IS3 family transposase [Chlamydiia bacterium]